MEDRVGRIVKEIEIEGQAAVALFDTGASYTYVRSALLTGFPGRAVPQPVRVLLGGRSIAVREVYFITGKIENLDFFAADAVGVENIGHAEGYALDAIIGARTMEQWEIRVDPKTGTLDLEGLRRREFAEYDQM
jgi:predicted aspartyl protease